MRSHRSAPRIPVNEFARITLRSGDKQCSGVLIDFGPSSCAVRITSDDDAPAYCRNGSAYCRNGPAHCRFDRWTIADVKSAITVILHGEHRPARIVRLQQLRKPFSSHWIVGLVLR